MNPKRYSTEWRNRAVRLVREHGMQFPSQAAAIAALAENLGCGVTSLRSWVRQADDEAQHKPLPMSEWRRLKQLERQNRELKATNENLRRASALFARVAFDRDPPQFERPRPRPASRAPGKRTRRVEGEGEE